MAVGTSQGTHFEDEFSHQAGIPLLPEGDEDMVKKPADTGDDNVLPPDEGSYDNKGGKIDASLKRVYITGHPENNTNDSEETGVAPSITDRLFGLNGVERYKTWPERMVTDLLTTAGKVSAGEVPMWSMTPDGEFHTSVEGLEAAHKLMPAANNLPVSIHMRGAGLSALEEYHAEPYETTAHEQFSQLLRQTRRQPSNIENLTHGEQRAYLDDLSIPEPPRPPASPILSVERPFEDQHIFQQEPFSTTEGAEARRTATSFHAVSEPNPYMPEAFRNLSREQVDALPDDRFYNYGHYQPDHGMTPAQEARWSRIDQQEADATRTSFTEADIPNAWEQPATEAPTHWSKDIRTKVDQAVNNDKISFFKDERRSEGRTHEFKFASKDGIGKIAITEKINGKELYVDHIGRVNQGGHIIWGNQAAHSFGTSEMKQLVKTLMKEFPKAEVLSGTRVSGARFNSRSTGYASIQLPGRGKSVEIPKPPRRLPSNDETDRALEAIRQALDSGSHLD